MAAGVGGLVLAGLIALPFLKRAAPAILPPQLSSVVAPIPENPGDWRGRIDYRAVDARLRAMMTDRSMQGLAVAIVEDGRLAFVHGYGYTAADNAERVSAKTVFRWASLSKTVAGTLTARLAADGALSLQDPLSVFNTSLKLPGDAQVGLTLEQLLAQRTGLGRNAYDGRLEDGEDPTVIRGSFASLKPVCPPGTCHTYQNIAYDTITEVIHARTGLDYAEAVKRRLFDVPAAAGVNSTIVDLAIWMQAQMGLRPDVLSGAVLGEVQRSRVGTGRPYGRLNIARELKGPGYGLGMRSFTYRGHNLVGHSGGVAGYRATMMFEPATRTGIVMLWNSDANLPFRYQAEFFDRVYGLPFTDFLELDRGDPIASGSELAD
ncbi:MAG: serine hydrolase [Caulobacter vibrioides]|uniref:Serine hydrolase n=1 Tax=Caulobacter vibrioides TaxID=155892 RepID=A0A258CY85_CAUVI|nr:MAG: serine hydrolase [Caulobacter vibrioides]